MTHDVCSLILESLSFTRDKFESYPYGDEALRKERLADVERAASAVREIRSGLKLARA